MPRTLPIAQKQLILNLAHGKYQGFNDSGLAENLAPEPPHKQGGGATVVELRL
jgi:hypothetical protein